MQTYNHDNFTRAINALNKEGLSKAEISRRSGIPSPSVEKLFQGSSKNPRLSTIIRLTKYFKVSPNEIVGWEK